MVSGSTVSSSIAHQLELTHDLREPVHVVADRDFLPFLPLLELLLARAPSREGPELGLARLRASADVLPGVRRDEESRVPPCDLVPVRLGQGAGALLELGAADARPAGAADVPHVAQHGGHDSVVSLGTACGSVGAPGRWRSRQTRG
jgi:hypothetical protein